MILSRRDKRKRDVASGKPVKHSRESSEPPTSKMDGLEAPVELEGLPL
jgi:hypothetical protein